jgi:hypothetical protein
MKPQETPQPNAAGPLLTMSEVVFETLKKL